MTPPTPQPPEPPRWPRSAQAALAVLLAACGGLLALRAAATRGGTPTELERGVVTAYRVDLNAADKSELMRLPGVGAKTADRILAYRDAGGTFDGPDDLDRVDGVGPATVERVRPHVAPSEPSTLSRKAPSPPATPAASRKADALASPIDVNAADVAELQKLPGIGPKLAQRILDERAKGPFRGPEDLRRVSGIGPKTVEKLRPHVTFGGRAGEG